LASANPAAEPIVLSGHTGRITAVTFSPDNHWLVTAGADKTACLWDMTAADPAANPIVLTGHERGILALAISPDIPPGARGRWLVTGGFDGTARLWDLSAADPAAASIVLRGHRLGILDLAISRDGHWLVTGSADGTARLWTLRPDELVGLACRIAGRNLTSTEWTTYFPGQVYRKTCINLSTYLAVIEDR
jgi:WD40 repeat protein